MALLSLIDLSEARSATLQDAYFNV